MANAIDPHVPTPPPGEDELPYSFGEPMESDRHRKQMYLLIEALELAWCDRDDVHIGGDMAIYFSETQTKKNDFRGPDVFVVLDTVRRERKSWVVWQEDGRTPDVVIELLSASTEHVDRGEKMRIYAKFLHVSEYYLFDPMTALLEGYELNPRAGGYNPIAVLPGGDLPCSRLGLRLGVRRGLYSGIETDWLRWIGEDGRVFPVGQELAADVERLRADAEQRLADAEQRLADALAEIERLKNAASKSGD